MDDRCLALAEDFISSRYLAAGQESLHATARTLRSILAQRRCPDEGLSDAAIELILRQLAMMDTNNFAAHVGGGEREGRVASALVRARHFEMTHGIGRSGDLTSEQPKAAGSSLLYQLTNVMMLDLIRLAGAASTRAAVVVPMATGMTLALVLRCVAKARVAEVKAEAGVGDKAAPRYVIWPRIDQKTALKCIDAAGLTPVPVELRPAPPPRTAKRDSLSSPSTSQQQPQQQEQEEREEQKADAHAVPSTHLLECHVDDIAAAVESVGGPAHVVCVLSTTSCFAPRLPDNTVAIAQYCKARCIPYVVNNAYGVQSRAIMTRLDAAQRLGRVDYVVQSSDKNFLVPVGGAVVCSSSAERCQAAAALYAGRASVSPVVDLFITALSLGRRGMQALWADRYRCREELLKRLRQFARARHEEVLVDDVEEPDGADTAAGDEKKRVAAAAAAAAASDGDGVKASAKRTTTRRKAAVCRNDISLAVTMRTFGASLPSRRREDKKETFISDAKGSAVHDSAAEPASWSAARAFGAQLFRSAVTGPRVILPAPSTPTCIAGCMFHNYGMHQEGRPPCPMLVIACGIGMTMAEVDALVRRLEELWPVPSVEA